jgi:quinoprotein glucose dehydrogenase
MNIKLASGVAVVVAAGGFFLAAVQAQAPARSVWDGVYTEGQADRGRTVYEERCALCHGQSLEGVEMAPALTGGQFLSTWNGQSVGDLYERMRTTMPVDDPGSLSRAANADVMAFLLRANKFPSGKVDLPRQNIVLNQILIEAKKRDQE